MHRNRISGRLIRFIIFYLFTIILIDFNLKAQHLTPENALGRMQLADGLKARIVAAEPLVRQPVAIDFDDRGRLWVIQYLQYPNPAGLNRIKVDRFSRTLYDRVPEPPPRGPKGADKLTILEDRDGDGRMDHANDFISGLNLTTGFAFGDSGVYVLQAPYLLHYADKNQDDVPDADPHVLLTGFGMDDAHSLANSLTWGTDGWLYGLQGSTVTAKIRGIEFQQGVWRYHPPTDRFELFAEGGGNMWGLDYDDAGNLFASTNFGPHIALHVMQDAYYWKQFGKHGPLHNPYAYGYFDHMSHGNPQGGHVTAGGLFYQADNWPDKYRGKYIGANVLSHWVATHDVSLTKSGFETRQTDLILNSFDPWFAPCDQALGLDGQLYVADWHDERMAHPDPDADWDRTNGRIYAVLADKTADIKTAIDFGKYNHGELIKSLGHTNGAISRRSRRLLKEQSDKKTNSKLKETWKNVSLPKQTRREAFWTLTSQTYDLNKNSPLDAAELIVAVNDTDFAIRRAAVQAIGDLVSEKSVELETVLIHRTREEKDTLVLGQMAATSARIGSIQLWEALVRYSVETADPQLPMRLWWSAEKISRLKMPEIIKTCKALDQSDITVFEQTILPRLMLKLAYEGGHVSSDYLADFIEAGGENKIKRLATLLEAMRGGAPKPAGRLEKELIKSIYHSNPDEIISWEIAARFGLKQTREDAETLIKGKSKELSAKKKAIFLRTAADLNWKNWASHALTATRSDSSEIRAAGWAALSRLMGKSEINLLILNYTNWDQKEIRDLLTSHADSAELLLNAIENGQIRKDDFDLTQIARIASFENQSLNEKALKIWGKVQSATPEERLAEVRRLNNDLRASTGNATKGRQLFLNNCARCHKLFGEGNSIGPELTGTSRTDRQWLLTSIVDPSGVVRKEYQSQILEMKDGRVLEGLILEQNGGLLKLIDSSGKETQVVANEVSERRDSTASLMPEGLYKQLKPQELRDLFAWLQQNQEKK